MLYLAEVQKKSTFMGNRSELKLLARQQAEHSWNPVPGDDVVPLDGNNDFSPGALVLVEVSANRQVQHIQDAGRPLVGILQNFSRLRERFRTQEEEIEGWKQSLVYQAQELTRREEELYELEQQAQDFAHQREELDRLREELQPLQDQVTREQQALANARQEFQAERQRWEELKASQGTGLSPEQILQVDQVVNQLQASLGNTATLGSCLEILQQHQSHLDQAWQTLEQSRGPLEEQQKSLAHQGDELRQEWERWQQAQSDVMALEKEVNVHNFRLQQQTEIQQQLQTQVHSQKSLCENLRHAADSQGLDSDFAHLFKMPLEQLQTEVEGVRKELKSMTSFVNDQEDELALVRQSIDELRLKMSQVSEFERLQLAGDLESEEQSYQLLNETLEGQRQRLYEKQYSLKKHEEIFQRRQEQPSTGQVDFQALLSQADAQLQQLEQLLTYTTNQAQETQAHLAQLQAQISQRQGEVEQWRQHLQGQQASFNQAQAEFAQRQGLVQTYNDFLPPLQDQVNRLRDVLQQEHDSRGNGHYSHLLGELQQVVSTLGRA